MLAEMEAGYSKILDTSHALLECIRKQSQTIQAVYSAPTTTPTSGPTATSGPPSTVPSGSGHNPLPTVAGGSEGAIGGVVPPPPPPRG